MLIAPSAGLARVHSSIFLSKAVLAFTPRYVRHQRLSYGTRAGRMRRLASTVLGVSHRTRQARRLLVSALAGTSSTFRQHLLGTATA